MYRKQLLAISLVVISLVMCGCGGGGGSQTAAGMFGLTDSSGYPISGSRAVASNHGISASIQGLGAYDQAAFLFTGPTGPAVQPPYGLPACSYFSIYTVNKNGSLPSQLISPKLPAGNYTLKIYDLKGSGATRQITSKSTSNLTVADNPPNIPAAEVGSISTGAFTANDSYMPGTDVYMRGSGFQPGQTVDLYVTAHKVSWTMNDSLIDVSGTVPDSPANLPAGTKAAARLAKSAMSRALHGTAKTITADANGRFGPLLTWQAVDAQADQSSFDVIVDVNQSGRFDPAHDLVVDQATGSFVVDSVTRAAPGNNVTLAYNQAMVPAKNFGQLENVRTRLSSRAVPTTFEPAAGINICRHKASWSKDDNIVDVSGPGGDERSNVVPIVNNRLVIPPMYAYHADLLPGRYDIVINVGNGGLFDPARDIIDGGNGAPAFTVSGAVPNKKWTVMVYLDGDNNLDQSAINNFGEMESVTYLNGAGKSDVNVVVQYANVNAYAFRYIVAHSTDPTHITTNPLMDLGKVNMADPGKLSQFIAWAKQVSPADHYALILWDHGTGFTSRAAPRSPTRNIIWADSFSGRSMTVPQVHDVLKQTGPFDLLACDACLMGMTEVAYEMRDVCSVFNGSEDLEPGHGYDYKAFLSDLVANPNMTAPQLGSSIVTAYKGWFTAHPDTTVTCSSTDETKIAAVATAIDGVVTAVTDNSQGATQSVMDNPTNRDNIRKLTYQTFQSPRFRYADGVDWFTQLKTLHLSTAIDAACDNVTAAYSRSNIAEYHNPSYTGAHGLTLWLPDQHNFDAFTSDYRGLQFAGDTQWLNFLVLLLNKGSKIDPASPTTGSGQTVTFTASTDTTIPPGSGLAYKWVTSGAHGLLSDTKGHSGASFQSTDNKVLYTPNPGATGTDTVTVDVIIVTGNQKADLGPAQAKVTISNNTTEGTATLVFTHVYEDGRITVYGLYTFAAVPNTKQYIFSSQYLSGTLDKADYDKGAPVVNIKRDGDSYLTIVGYGNSRFVNMGGGTIGIFAYGGSYKYDASNEAFQHSGAVDATSFPATVTLVQ